MRAGEILDRGFQVTPAVVRALLPFFLVMGALGALLNTFDEAMHSSTLEFLYYGLRVFEMLLSVYLYLVTIIVADSAWCGRPVDGRAARRRITAGTFGLLLLQWIVISFGTMFFALFLFIPGIVFFLNRFVAPYSVLIEGTGAFEAMRRSKALMTFSPLASFGSFRSPKGRLTGLMLVTFIVSFVPAFLLGGAAGFAGLFTMTAQFILFFAVSFVTVVCNAFANVTYLGFFHDLKLRSDGDDLLLQIAELSR